MSEQKLQKKIIDYLEKIGFYVVKTITCNKKGVPDILACAPDGVFVAIEVKYGANIPSKLQEYNIQRIVKNRGIAFVAWDLESVIVKLKRYSNGTR